MVYDYDALRWFGSVTHLSGRGIITLDIVPEVVEDLVAVVARAGEKSVANEGGEGPHAHQQPRDVHQRQQEEVSEAPPRHDSGHQPPALGQVLRWPHPPPAPRTSRVPMRRRRRTRRAAAPAPAAAHADGLVCESESETVSASFGFHDEIISLKRERENDLMEVKNDVFYCV